MSPSFVLVISSPSGAGKSTLCSMLTDKYPEIAVSISATTRPSRSGEVHCVHYFFLSEEEFEAKVKNQDFVEHALVYNNRYGTLKSEVNRLLDAGKIPMFNVDWQGASQIKKSLKGVNVVSVFILPPSVQEVFDRLCKRGQDSISVVEERMLKFPSEVRKYKNYDYIIVNDNLSDAFGRLETILNAEKLKVQTLTTMPAFANALSKQKYVLSKTQPSDLATTKCQTSIHGKPLIFESLKRFFHVNGSSKNVENTSTGSSTVQSKSATSSDTVKAFRL